MTMNEPGPALARARARSRELEQHRGFVDRHIGTDRRRAGGDARACSAIATRGALIDAVVPAAIRGAASRSRCLPAKGEEKRSMSCKRSCARRTACYRSYIGQGYYGTLHTGRDPAQRPRESRLVHRVYALPAGNLAGAARGAGQFPDDDLRPHRRWRSPTRRCSTKRPPRRKR